MLPAETERLWEDYLAAERVRIRQESLVALECFIRALLQSDSETWQLWARQIAHRIVDDGEDTPVRFPLFRSVLFPALHAGLESSVPGSARCLAGFAGLLYKSPSCSEQLPENLRSEYGLLLRAAQDNPNDVRVKKRLLSLMRSHFDYALHELPAGVLCGHDGASTGQCDELMEDLSAYERLALDFGVEEDWELIAEARFHIPAYQRYLAERGRHANYEGFLMSLGSDHR